MAPSVSETVPDMAAAKALKAGSNKAKARRVVHRKYPLSFISSSVTLLFSNRGLQ